VKRRPWWKPTLHRFRDASGRQFAVGVETHVEEHEAHFHWGSQSLPSTRSVSLLLGPVDLEWRWEIGS